ncbi:MAG: F0F1 ATP synthase subunit A, partial [Anaerolineales bacterium]|nr:F0F1 ATP synthase subunit A [Anaerolineales bacterium]
IYLFYVAMVPYIMPEVLLPAETVFTIGGFPVTNTLIALFFVDLIVFSIAFGVKRAVASGKNVLTGIPGAVEGLINVIYDMTEGMAGKWAKSIFPWFATIMLMVLVANWMELLPGIETFGLVHESSHGEYAIKNIGPFQGIVKPEGGAEGEGHGGYALIPYVRVVSSDLNFTIAIALVVVVMIQVFGIRSQGMAYFTKFWNVKTMFSKPIFGVIDFGVGILEIVSEFSKVLSFAFRLFGNIFAGSVLLFVIGSLMPVFAQSIFYLLEFFVGAIQAFVFGLLASTFMAQATQGHGEHHEESHA